MNRRGFLAAFGMAGAVAALPKAAIALEVPETLSPAVRRWKARERDHGQPSLGTVAGVGEAGEPPKALVTGDRHYTLRFYSKRRNEAFYKRESEDFRPWSEREGTG